MSQRFLVLFAVAAVLLLLSGPADAIAGPAWSGPAVRLQLDSGGAGPSVARPWRLLPKVRLARHGPDDPFPDDGYEIEGSAEKGVLILIGVALSVAGLVTLGLGLAQNKRMEEAICQAQLTEIWTRQRALGISTLGLLGGGLACLSIQFAF